MPEKVAYEYWITFGGGMIVITRARCQEFDWGIDYQTQSWKCDMGETWRQCLLMVKHARSEVREAAIKYAVKCCTGRALFQNPLPFGE